jgi:hypothetical protein
MPEGIELSLQERLAILVALDTAYGRVSPDPAPLWESNDSGLYDEELNRLVEKLNVR